MKIKRGDIYYVESIYSVGSEQRSGRPAIIVSNEKNNEHSGIVEVVYLTTQPKADLPTHVLIRSTDRESTALCEQITSVSVERIGDYKGHVTETEMAGLEIAMLVSLDLQIGPVKEKVVEVIKEVPVEPTGSQTEAALAAELAAANAKYEVLQAMYESLLSRVLGKEASV